MADRCPGCGGVVDTARNVFVCGRQTDIYSPATVQCERHQKWDAQVEAKALRARVARLEAAMHNIRDTYAAGTFAGDIARAALRADA